MKKTLIVSIGIILILFVVGFWAYLMMFGKPKSAGEVFSNFGIETGTNTETLTEESVSTVDVSPQTTGGQKQALRQLTTRPTVGSVIIDSTIRYVERGTGYMYDIDLNSGSEVLVSGTTFSRITSALFSASGNRVVLERETGNSKEVLVGSIIKNDNGEGSFEGTAMPTGAREFAFSTSGELLTYIIPTENGSAGYIFDFKTKVSKELFNIPLNDIEMLWGDILLAYTTPSLEATGYLYKIRGNSLEYIMPGKPGLMAISGAKQPIVTYTDSGTLITETYSEENSIPIAVTMLPEKCTPHGVSEAAFMCAAPPSLPNARYPDDWYKGVISLSDVLWKIDLYNGEAELLTDMEAESGRQIDVSMIGTNGAGTLIWFINKNDDTLWMFDTTL